MDLILEKTIGSILESKNYSYSKEFLDQLTELSLQFIQDLAADLSTYTRIQRRHQPSLSDIKLLLKIKHIRNDDLIKEIDKSANFPYSQELEKFLQLQSKQSVEQQEDDDQARAFFEQSSIMQLLPKLNNAKPKYIPSYLPDLPPDYTYQSTPEYNEPLTDLKELRVKLVQESRMTEDSLYKLIENDEIEWRKKFEDELKTMEDEVEGAKPIVAQDEEDDKNKHPENELKKEIPSEESNKNQKPEVMNGESKEVAKQLELKDATTQSEFKEDSKFDIVAYAQKRKQLAIKKKKKLEDHYKARENDIYMKAELYYSPYATKKPTADVNKYFQDIISDGFKEVIVSVRKAEIAKQAKIKQMREEQERREKELQQKNEITFNFPALNHSDSDDSDNEDNIVIDKKEELNFDVPENPQESKPALVVVHNGDILHSQQQQQPEQEKQEQHQVLSIPPVANPDTKNSENQEQSQKSSPGMDINLEDELNAHFGTMSPATVVIPTQEVSDISSEEDGSDEEMEIIA